MAEAPQFSRPPNAMRRARAAGRNSDLRARLLHSGAMLFAQRGTAAVSVEDLIAAAEVSRATFYGFFANKSELVTAILVPVFETGTVALSKLRSSAPGDAAEGLVDVYLDLWREHRDALVLTGNVDESIFSSIRSVHDAFNDELLIVLSVAESSGQLRNGSAKTTLRVLANTAIPLLRVYNNQENYESIYKESILGLILKGPS